METPSKAILYGSAVILEEGGAVFIQGLSGSGKSDLCFRLIEAGGKLICDDQVAFERRQGKIMASAVDVIRGLLEIRGVGLVKVPVAPQTRLVLAVRLVAREDVPRLPDWETMDILGVAVPQLKLHAFDNSTPLKIMKAIELVHKPELLIK